jgi:hypothetical protein
MLALAVALAAAQLGMGLLIGEARLVAGVLPRHFGRLLPSRGWPLRSFLIVASRHGFFKRFKRSRRLPYPVRMAGLWRPSGVVFGLASDAVTLGAAAVGAWRSARQQAAA